MAKQNKGKAANKRAEPKTAAEQNAENSSSGKKESGMVLDGVVTEALRGKFRVEILVEGEDPDDKTRKRHEVIAHLAGKLRTNWIKIVPGDKVQVEVSPYDVTRGRIIYRMKK